MSQTFYSEKYVAEAQRIFTIEEVSEMALCIKSILIDSWRQLLTQTQTLKNACIEIYFTHIVLRIVNNGY